MVFDDVVMSEEKLIAHVVNREKNQEEMREDAKKDEVVS